MPGSAAVTELNAGHSATDEHARSAHRWGSIAAATGVALLIVAVAVAIAGDVTWQSLVESWSLTNLVIGLGFLAPGATILWFRPSNVIGALFVFSGLGHLASAAAAVLGLYGVHAAWPVPIVRTLSTLATGAWQVSIGVLFLLALLLFPDGHLPSRRWRPVVWLIVVSGSYQILTGVLSSGSPFGETPDTWSILYAGLEMPEPISVAMGVLSDVLFLLVIVSLVIRYRRGDERTRRQLLWLILAVIGIVVINLPRLLTAEGPILLVLSFVLVPIAIGIAIVRYELFDIRFVVSRTILYGLTLSAVVAVYAAIVTGVSLLVPADAERGVQIGAAIVVAIGFNHLRLLLQRAIDRAFYGTRSDPVHTARRISERLQHDDDLAGVLNRTREALRLPWIALRRDPDGGELAAAGATDSSPSAEIALSYRGERVGTLVIGLRRGESRLHEADRRLLELIATPIAVALHATALSEQIQQARTATVEAAAAERVRLQRELHDGLGPALTSVAFRADAASNIVRSDSDEAVRLLAEVRADLRAALDYVRRVVYGLRPIELDDLGLVGALRQKVTALPGTAGREIAVELAAPGDPLPALSPAVELAAYRIANEALTNVLRHSTGCRCMITVAVDGDLVVTVSDDGDADPSWRPGVGLRSIVDRAEELGGSATAGPVAAGWEVCARLPLHSSPSQ